MTIDQIISQASQRRLKTAAPALRIVPRHEEPEVDLDDIDIIAWAKTKAARGERLVEVPKPQGPRKYVKQRPGLRYLVQRSGWWHFQKRRDGNIVRFALKTRDLAEAQRRRDEILQNTQP